MLETDDFEAAIEQYQQVLEVQPHNARVHNQLGQAFERQGDLDQAMTCFEVALEQNPLLIQARLNLGKITLESDPRQAENWFKSVLDIDPKTVEGYYWLGISISDHGEI